MYIYKKEQDQTCFQYDMVYVDFQDLPRKAISDKVLQEKAFAIVSNSQFGRYERGLAPMVYTFFDIKAGDFSR